MKTVFTALVFLFVELCNAQTFQRTYGNTGSETGTCIKSTLDGNYVISGMSNAFSNGYLDAVLYKINSGGNLLWSKAYGGTYHDRAYYVSSCTDGGFILTGSTSLFATGSNTNLYLVRTDSDGNLGWSRAIGGSADDYGWYVQQTADGGFLCAGGSKSFNTGNWDGYVVKTDAAGTLQWTRVIGGTASDEFHGMSLTSDGGCILTGTTATNSFGSSDIWLVKLNSAGDTLWTRQHGKLTEDAGNAVIPTADGGYAIAGDVHVQPASGNHNSCILKTDSNGNLQWVKSYGSNPGTEIAWDIRQNSDSTFMLFGSSATFGNGGGGDMIAIKTNVAGTLLWANAYGGTGFEDFWFSQRSANGGTLLAGLSSVGGNNILVISIDSVGNSSCNTTTIAPDVNSPSLQTRSGTTVITAGAMSTPNTIAYPAPSLTGDPCLTTSEEEISETTLPTVVFPNPSNGTTVFFVNHPIEPGASVAVFDLFGNQVHLQPITSQTTLLSLALPPGLYFFRLSSGNNSATTGKIIITY